MRLPTSKAWSVPSPVLPLMQQFPNHYSGFPETVSSSICVTRRWRTSLSTRHATFGGKLFLESVTQCLDLFAELSDLLTERFVVSRRYLLQLQETVTIDRAG